MTNEDYLRTIDVCSICNKPIKESERRMSLTWYDEVLEGNEMQVKNAWNLASYHYNCSPIKINKKIFEVN